MFSLLCKTILRHGRRHTAFTHSPIHKHYFLQNLFITARCISSDANLNQQSFAVSYLINKCGFSPESALSASKHLKFETPDKPDSVIDMFKCYGFPEAEIFKLVKKYPRLLSCNLEKALPKLEFFRSKGMSGADIAKIVCVVPLLGRSLENHITPTFKFLTDLFQSNDKVITVVKRNPRILFHDCEKYLKPYINILQDNGVPEPHIVSLIYSWSRCINVCLNHFRNSVEMVREMGLNPSEKVFILAVLTSSQLSKSGWERKVAIYKSWGFSEEEILAAFRKDPWFMMTSEHKIMEMMDYLVNKLDCKPSFLAKNPTLVLRSLKKTIVPRAEVVQYLLSKQLIDRMPNLVSLFVLSEKLFLEKFVYRFHEAPQLLKLYEEKVNPSK